MSETTANDGDVVLVQRDGGIATVVLNRPEKLNALNKAMWERIAVVMRELGADETVRCVVLSLRASAPTPNRQPSTAH